MPKLSLQARLLLTVVVSFLTVAASTASAQAMNWRKHGVPDWATPADIEAEKHLRNIMMYMSSRTKSEIGIHYRYESIAKVVRAAGVQDDSALSEEEKEQVRKVWKRFEEKELLVCNSLRFDVSNGSLLKYAVCDLFDEFVYFAADVKIGLDKVDKNDGRTVLDYVKDRIDRLPEDSSLRSTYKHYYDILRKAGAKHRAELGDKEEVSDKQ